MPTRMSTPDRARPRFWIPGLAPWILIALGVLHSIVGFSGGRDTLADMARAGLWDTVHSGGGPPSRPLIFWFLTSGFMLLMLGHLALWVERRTGNALPLSFGIELLLFAALAGVLSGGGIPAWLFGTAAIYSLLVTWRVRGSDVMRGAG